MRHLTAASIAASLALTLPGPAPAQDDDRGRLEALIEDNLSGEGFQVDVVGFEGALSSEARLEALTIADADGVWLTLRGVVLDWNRAALLRGRVSVNELVADEILVPRLPGGGGEADAELPDAEAQPFRCPNCPCRCRWAASPPNASFWARRFWAKRRSFRSKAPQASKGAKVT